MDETEEPQQELEQQDEPSRSTLFKDGVVHFQEAERAEAEFYLSVYDQILNSPDRRDLWKQLQDFTISIMKEKGKDAVQKCKLYNLFTGSGQSPERWQAMPMDTADGDYKKFVNDTLMPLLAENGGEDSLQSPDTLTDVSK